jgi:hypothetical protein
LEAARRAGAEAFLVSRKPIDDGSLHPEHFVHRSGLSAGALAPLDRGGEGKAGELGDVCRVFVRTSMAARIASAILELLSDG